MKLIETIPGSDWSRVEERAFLGSGIIVDLGCLTWDWSSRFIQEGRTVIGVDPWETNPIPERKNVTLIQACIGPFRGKVDIPNKGYPSSCYDAIGGEPCERIDCITWQDILTLCSISLTSSIDCLKINIEGMEWPLLASWPDPYFDNIHQIAVSFHCYKWPHATATKAITSRLESLGYESQMINNQWHWYLFVKK